MADTVSGLIANMEVFQYQPALIQGDIFDHLTRVRNGEIEIVDPSNPFVFNTQAATVVTAGFMENDEARQRRKYANMAQTPEDLYDHITDWDYVDRFAKPSTAVFGIALSRSEVLSKLVTDPATGIRKLVIARNTTITVAGTVFSMQYPVEIRQMLHGGLQVVYDADQVSPLQTLSTNVIPWEIRPLQGDDMLYFELELTQMSVTAVTGTITKAQAFRLTQNITDQYYFTRVWAMNPDGTWRELKTTMSPDIYDVADPTAVIKVVNKQVQIYIPQVYTTTNQLSGKIRADVYETKGPLDMDLGAYPQNAFVANFTALDANDQTVYTAPMSTLTVISLMSDKMTLGGANELSFEDLRSRVINNAMGRINLPITQAQMQAELNRNGYDVIKSIDNITSRVFLASKPMPTPTNQSLISAAAASIETITTSMSALAAMPTVVDNGDSLTITPDTIYKNLGGIVSVAQNAEIQAILALPPSQRALAINQQNYYYTPFHYVLDNQGVEFAVRPYYLDAPSVVTKLYIGENESTLLSVSTGSYSIVRTPTGYQLVVITTSSDEFKALDDDQIFVQLAFTPQNEQDRAYVNGVLQGFDPTTGERVYTFDLSTTFNIDSNDAMEFTKFTMYTPDARIVKGLLTTQFDILWATDAVVGDQFVPNAVDGKLGRWLLPNDIKGITNEQIRLQFGSSLKTLWARARSVVGDMSYQRYAVDELAFYTTDIYAVDENGSYITFVDGQPTINYLHRAGDPVLDGEGHQVIRHHAGDVMVDAGGVPIPGGTRDLLRQIDIMMLEGAYFFATDSVAQGYRAELIQTLLAWMLDELAPIQNALLDQTLLYFYPKSTQGFVDVINQNGVKMSIRAGQSLIVTLYVSKQTYNNTDLRTRLERATVSALNLALDNTTISQSELVEILRAVYGADVIDVQLTGLGGVNLPVFSLVDASTRCGLRKILIAQGDDTLIVQEDVTVVVTLFDPEGNQV